LIRKPNLIGKLRAGLPAPARSLLDQLIKFGEVRGLPVYLVGGPLRDLLLDQRSLDLDIAIEGDATSLARQLAESMSRENKAGSARPEALAGRAAVTTSEPRVVTHPAFLTATVRIPSFHVDLITARSETYRRPGALPTVTPATIEDDLLRRDFTINALALSLNDPKAGEVRDPSVGLADLDARLVRVLHERSFQDDATRILRAVRYASRFGFEIEPQTLAWLKRDVRYLEYISGARLHHELSRIFAEDAPEDILRRVHDLGALTAIHPALRFGPPQAHAFPSLRELNATGARAAHWPVLAWSLSEPQALDVSRRLAATKPQREALAAMPGLQRLGPNLAGHSLKRSAIAEVLAPFPLPTLWAFAALTDDPTVRDRILDYLTEARYQRPYLTGNDLLALGVPEGPQLGEILRRLRNARLDGEVTTRDAEQRLVRELIAESDKARRQSKKAAPSRSS
jgi:tRNA nucleotidyltransferase (CCA-adding enzyme)